MLTKEIAEQFMKEEDSVDLSLYSEFEDSAIEALSNYDGQLSLDALVKEVKEWEYLVPPITVFEKVAKHWPVFFQALRDLEFDIAGFELNKAAKNLQST